MKKIVIRTDASLIIGSGHVMRCRNLARELHRRGNDVTFICRKMEGDLIDLLQDEFNVLTLREICISKERTSTEAKLKDRRIYKDWLRCSQAKDAADTLEALQKAKIKIIDWIIVDHYGIDIEWEASILNNCSNVQKPKLLAIDDIANRNHQADRLLDQNYFGDITENRYSTLVPQDCHQLLGPHYALMSPEYANLYPMTPKRTEIRRLLVFFGGVDPHNLTGSVLRALEDSSFDDLQVDVVLGRQSPNRRNIEKLVARRARTTLHTPLPSLAGLMIRADLAIGASGSTNWERLSLHLPTLVISFGKDQEPIAKALHQKGLIKYMGDAEHIESHEINTALKKILNKPIPEMKLTLTDGWGVSRISNSILGVGNRVSLKVVTISDEALLLRWANDPSVRSQSFCRNRITSLEHHEWLERGLKSKNRLHYILIDIEGCPIGQIRFDRNHENLEHRQQALIDFSLDQCVRNQGLSKKLLKLGLDAARKEWGNGIEAVGIVMKGNKASQATFKKCGFLEYSNYKPKSTNSILVEKASKYTCYRKIL